MKNYVTLPQNTLIDSTAMATLTLTIKVPDNKAIDMDALKLQVEAIANAVVAVPSILKKEEPDESHIFDCFSGNYGGDRDANEIADELRNNRTFTREIAAL